MKRTGLARVVLLIALVIVAAGIWMYRWPASNSFATRAHLKYHYNDKVIDVEITDAKDVGDLKSILTGYVDYEMVTCGFTDEVTITLSNDRKSVVFYPALAGYGIFGIGSSGGYLNVSDKKRHEFDDICRRYGVDFSWLTK